MIDFTLAVPRHPAGHAGHRVLLPAGRGGDVGIAPPEETVTHRRGRAHPHGRDRGEHSAHLARPRPGQLGSDSRPPSGQGDRRHGSGSRARPDQVSALGDLTRPAHWSWPRDGLTAGRDGCRGIPVREESTVIGRRAAPNSVLRTGQAEAPVYAGRDRRVSRTPTPQNSNVQAHHPSRHTATRARSAPAAPAR